MTTSFKLSSEEWKRVFIQMIPLIIFTLATGMIFFVDFSLATFLAAIEDKAKFTISFDGT